jgi:hypothetical protein
VTFQVFLPVRSIPVEPEGQLGRLRSRKRITVARAFSGKVGSGFPPENATNAKAFSGKVESGFPSENATNAKAFSGKVESGFPSENATKAKMLERFPFPVSVKPL